MHFVAHEVKRFATAVAAACCLNALCANAAQPLVNDNAAPVDAGACQVEAWMRFFHRGYDVWAVPACNRFAGVEIAAGGARTFRRDGDQSSQFQLQAKTLLIADDASPWSLGASAGAQRDTAAPHGRAAFQTFYAKALTSFIPSNDIEVDINAGLANTYGVGTYALAGAAIQYALYDRLQALGEIFRDEPGRAKYQAGVRYTIVPGRFEAYLSYGNRIGSHSTQWWTIAGVRLQTAP